MVDSCDPHWTAYCSALLTPFTALFAIWIAFQQWRTARNKLKIDLFEKRVKIYGGARSLIESIIRDGKAKDEELFKFLVSTREANWLLSKQVQTYMEKYLYRPACELSCLDFEIQGMPVGEDKSNKVGRKSELVKDTYAQCEMLEKVFAPYLQVSH